MHEKPIPVRFSCLSLMILQLVFREEDKMILSVSEKKNNSIAITWIATVQVLEPSFMIADD